MSESKTTNPPHTDDLAVDRFAGCMKEKLAQARAKGRGGWERCPEDYLMAMLREHVEKGDMRDVANLAMMIHLNREASDARSNAWMKRKRLESPRRFFGRVS